MIMRVLLLSTLVLMWATLCWGHSKYNAMIPNGNKVPNPCHVGEFALGVGHTDPLGGGHRNKLGNDFKAAGKVSVVKTS